MENTIDSIISISTNKTKERSIISSFTYNKYSNGETTNKDDIITNNLKRNNNDIKNKFIRLRIANSINSSTFTSDLDLDEFTLDLPELYNAADISSLSESDLTYFNRQINYNNKRNYYIFKLDREEVDTAVSFLTSNEEISNLDKTKILRTSTNSSKISVLKDDELNLDLLNNNNIFSNDDIFEENEIVNKTSIDTSQSNQVKNGFLFNTFKPIKQIINNEGFISFSLKNGVRCGLLLEKFKLIYKKIL